MCPRGVWNFIQSRYVVILLLLMIPNFPLFSQALQGRAELYNTFEVVDLRGYWRLRTEDDPRFAMPDYDDNHWRLILTPSPWYARGINYSGVAWYRITLAVAPRVQGRNLAVVLLYLQAAYEIYLNGRHIGGLGIIGPRGELEQAALRLRTYRLPSELLRSDGNNVIALRVRSFSELGGIVGNELYAGTTEQVERKYERAMFWNALLAGLFLFVGIVHLLMGVWGRRDSAYTYYALLAVVTGLIHGSVTTIIERVIDFYYLNILLLHGSVAAIPFLSIMFFHRFFQTGSRGLEKISAALFCMIFAFHTFALFEPDYYVFYLRFVFRPYLLMLLLVNVYCLIINIKAIKRGVAGAVVLALGFLIFGLTALHEISVYFAIYESNRLLDEGFLCFILGMQAALSVRYSHLHQRLRDIYHDLKEHVEQLERARKKVADSEQKYRDLVEGAHDIIFSLDSLGMMQSVNSAVADRLGFSPRGLLGRPIYDLLYERAENAQRDLNRIVVQERFQDVLENHREMRFRTLLKNRLGEPREFEMFFEYVGTVSPETPLFVRASAVVEDELSQLLLSERQCFVLGNYFGLADLVSHRLAGGVIGYGGQDSVLGVKLCLREIIINAIEHGNLQIDYNEKARAQQEGNYIDFLKERQRDPAIHARTVRVDYSLNRRRAIFRVSDEGRGFDHKIFMNREPEDLNISGVYNGRGILMARNEFDKMYYNRKGNKVTLVKFFGAAGE